MMTVFDALTPEEWGGFNCRSSLHGAIANAFLFQPSTSWTTVCIPGTWAGVWVRKDAKLDKRTAGVLVPFMFVLMMSTVDQESVKGWISKFGVKVDGEWGGQWRVRVKDGAFTYEPADNLDGMPAVFHFKNGLGFCAHYLQRFPGGETSGDSKVIDQVRHMFFRI